MPLDTQRSEPAKRDEDDGWESFSCFTTSTFRDASQRSVASLRPLEPLSVEETTAGKAESGNGTACCLFMRFLLVAASLAPLAAVSVPSDHFRVLRRNVSLDDEADLLVHLLAVRRRLEVDGLSGCFGVGDVHDLHEDGSAGVGSEECGQTNLLEKLATDLLTLVAGYDDEGSDVCSGGRKERVRRVD